MECGEGMKSNERRTGCVFVDSFIQPGSIGEIVVLIGAGLGILADLVVLAVILRHRHTPVVVMPTHLLSCSLNHALPRLPVQVCSNRPLTVAMLVILLVGFLLPFLFLAPPAPALCGLEAVLLGSVFSSITGIFLVKTR